MDIISSTHCAALCDNIYFYLHLDANSITNSNILFASWLDFGVTSWCVPVYINDDNSVEDTEQFTLQLVSNNLQVEIDVNHSTITININEDSDDCKLN